MSIDVGDTVVVNNEIRTVTDLRRNSENGIIVIWASGVQTKGGCIPALWNEWAQGVDQNQRR